MDMANHETLGRSPRHRAEVTPRVREETPGNVRFPPVGNPAQLLVLRPKLKKLV